MSTTTSRTRAAINESELCQFPFNDGRRCRMLRHPGHSCLCIFHARAESQLVETDRLGAELAETVSGDFMTATDINHALGRLYTAVAQNRIPIRNASTLARIGSTLLHTVPAIKSEFKFEYSFDQWKKMLQNAPPLSTHDTPDFPANQPIPINSSAPSASTTQSASVDANEKSTLCKSLPKPAPTRSGPLQVQDGKEPV
jgi:hypothetical protein